MNNLEKAFENKNTFVGFLTAGDPSLEKTEEYILDMARAGAKVVEIGIPFSDPIAEGAVIQAANVRALSNPNGCTVNQIFEMVNRVSKKTDIGLVFLTYLNPVYNYGYDRFMKRCSETGISGIIIPDMPFEEKGELEPFAKKYGVHIISLIAPTSDERIAMIAKEATGYIYVVSSMGVTGVRSKITTDIKKIVDVIRKNTNTPVAIGFGINTPEQVKYYENITDGVIVGSAIVKIIEEYKDNANEKIYEYVKSMVNPC